MGDVVPFTVPGEDPREADDGFESYGFAREFEHAIVAHAMTSPRFWGAVGANLMPEGFKLEPAQLILQAVRQIAKDHGKGPRSTATVLQRLKSWMDEGRVDKGELKGVRALLVQIFDSPVPPEDEVIDELAPVLMRRVRDRAADELLKTLAQRGDTEHVERMLADAKRIGKVDNSRGQRVDPSGFQLVRRMASLKRLGTGISDLDDELKGGPREGCYCLFTGGGGVGKSTALSTVMAHAMTEGLAVAMATLELNEDLQFTRLCANLVNLPVDDLLDDMMSEGERRLAMLVKDERIGIGVIKHFAPRVTTVANLKDWLLMEQEFYGVAFDVLVVDYADKMGSADVRKKKSDADSEVAEELRNLMDREIHADLGIRWVWSASQAKAVAHDRKKTKKVEGHHAADSIDKLRICDLMITMNPRDDGDSMLYHVAKNRIGVSSGDVGPIATDNEYGRIAAPERPGWPFGR